MILTFNIGCQAFSGSTLLKMINVGDLDGAANEFQKWHKSGGKDSNGLFRRRLAEAEYFRTGHLDSSISIWNDVEGHRIA